MCNYDVLFLDGTTKSYTIDQVEFPGDCIAGYLNDGTLIFVLNPLRILYLEQSTST